MGKRVTDLRGRRFGDLEPLEFVGIGPNRSARWRCACHCGCGRTDVVKAAKGLVSGGATSCRPPDRRPIPVADRSGRTFRGAIEAAQAEGVTRQAIAWRAKNGWGGWRKAPHTTTGGA